MLVLPYLTHEINRDKEYFEAYYDDIVVPTELMGVHYKAAIKKRNRWMVDRADVVLHTSIVISVERLTPQDTPTAWGSRF